MSTLPLFAYAEGMEELGNPQVINSMHMFTEGGTPYTIDLDSVDITNKALYSLGNLLPIDPADVSMVPNKGQLLGTSDSPWLAVYAYHFSNESDRRLKENILYNLEKYPIL